MWSPCRYKTMLTPYRHTHTHRHTCGQISSKSHITTVFRHQINIVILLSCCSFVCCFCFTKCYCCVCACNSRSLSPSLAESKTQMLSVFESLFRVSVCALCVLLVDFICFCFAQQNLASVCASVRVCCRCWCSTAKSSFVSS